MALPNKYQRSDDLIAWLALLYEEISTALTNIASLLTRRLQARATITVSGGTPTLAASENITSITDTGAGRVTITIADDFANTTWTSAASLDSGSVSSSFVNFANKAAGSIEIRSVSLTDTFIDPDGYDFVGFGDQ
jgi:hypothetical protein